MKYTFFLFLFSLSLYQNSSCQNCSFMKNNNNLIANFFLNKKKDPAIITAYNRFDEELFISYLNNNDLENKSIKILIPNTAAFCKNFNLEPNKNQIKIALGFVSIIHNEELASQLKTVLDNFKNTPEKNDSMLLLDFSNKLLDHFGKGLKPKYILGYLQSSKSL